MATREVTRRLGVDVKTVRRHLRKIENGAGAPYRTSPGSKLDPFLEQLAEVAGTGMGADAMKGKRFNAAHIAPWRKLPHKQHNG